MDATDDTAVPDRCARCETSLEGRRAYRLEALRPEVRAALERERSSGLPAEADSLCVVCAHELRTRVLVDRLEAERGALSALERDVAAKAEAHASIVRSLTESFEREATPGQRIADTVARVGGSWLFVGTFLTFIAAWIAGNLVSPGSVAPDPYPFILLNLVLSCIAALQAPIIMMSQNRAAARDRREADMDFRVNLKAELEVAALHDKIDHLLHTRWEDLMEVQRAQLDLLEDLAAVHGRARNDAPPSRVP